MSGTLHPTEPPPSYEAATGSSSASSSIPPRPLSRISTDEPSPAATRNGIPPERRRSMEDENRPLPPGWIRQFDPQEQHQFFVDTNADPPRSTWTHPYDDEQFLSTLSPEERKKHSRLHRSVTLDDLAAEDTDDEDSHHHSQGHHQNTSAAPPLPPRAEGPQPTGIHKFGRKMKDKLTASTHEQREQQRRTREERERKAYQAHLKARQAMARALETGEPQFLYKDARGQDVYIVPPHGPSVPQGAFGYNPYRGGPYMMGNGMRYARPMGPYQRRPGYGYGGGMGVGAPIAAGLVGGALLGGMLM